MGGEQKFIASNFSDSLLSDLANENMERSEGSIQWSPLSALNKGSD